MGFLSTKLILSGFLFLLIVVMPENILARTLESAEPHEVWNDCGTWCESTCENPAKPGDACVAMCKRGYFCGEGYIRSSGQQGSRSSSANRGPCITLSECAARQSNNN